MCQGNIHNYDSKFSELVDRPLPFKMVLIDRGNGLRMTPELPILPLCLGVGLEAISAFSESTIYQNKSTITRLGQVFDHQCHGIPA